MYGLHTHTHTHTHTESVSTGHYRLSPSLTPTPTPGCSAAKPEPVILTVSEENVRQMPPKPFRDSARNINGDRTGKGKGVNEGILELWEGKGRRWGKHPPSSHSFFLMGAQQARPLTFGVPRGQGHEGAGCSKAGTVEVDRAKGAVIMNTLSLPSTAAPAPALQFPEAWPDHLTCQPGVWAGGRSGP